MNNIETKQVDMLHGSLGKSIFFFALPLAATGILQQLFNAADVAVVGRFVGKEAMAAVGSNGPVVGLLVNLFVGVSLGANVVIANLTGKGNRQGVERAVDAAIFLAITCGLFATLVGELLAEPVLRAMDVPPEVYGMAEDYLRIYLAGMPVILLYNFEAAIFRSQGDSKTPLLCLTASGIINVGLNLLFVLGLGMTANGVALATVISNVVCAGLLFIMLLRRKDAIGLRGRAHKLEGASIGKILSIGLPAGAQSAMFSLSNICIQSAINGLGSDVMAASSAAFNIEILAYYVINAFGQACTTFTGQNDGAGNDGRCRSVLRVSLAKCMVCALVISGGILLAGKPLLLLFNDDATVIRLGFLRLKYILYFEGINVLIEVFSGAMRGYGHSLIPALLALLGICGMRIVWVYTVFASDNRYTTLMACYPISWAITAAGLITAYAIFRRRRSRRLASAART